VDAALKIKSQFGGKIRCVLQWTADFEAINQRTRPNNWKAVLLESQLQARSSGSAVLIGHSSGGNAALEVAERYPVDSLVVLGAGYCDHDRRCSDIQHWDYDAIVSNVRRRIVVLHGADDHVVRSSEATSSHKGCALRSRELEAPAVRGWDTSVREAGIGHAMQQRCPPALSHVLSSVILESCQD
jgi:pimeloyl-ACP methyl ester carboxylesterase